MVVVVVVVAAVAVIDADVCFPVVIVQGWWWVGYSPLAVTKYWWGWFCEESLDLVLVRITPDVKRKCRWSYDTKHKG